MNDELQMLNANLTTSHNLSILLSEDAIEKFKQKKSNKQQQSQTIDDCVQMIQLALKAPRAASQSNYSQLYETQLRNFDDCVQMIQLALKAPRAASQSNYSQLYETQLRNFEQLLSKTFF